jgi:hypothetical protein
MNMEMSRLPGPVRAATKYRSACTPFVMKSLLPSPYMRNTPNFGASGMGAFRLALRPSASTRRVSAGSMTPSSHRRALA